MVEGSRIRREYLITPGRIEGRGRRGKPLKADYILEYRNTMLAVVEAKPDTDELTEGVAQAKDYASKLAVRYACATNGHGIYRIDMHTGANGFLCFAQNAEIKFRTKEQGDEVCDAGRLRVRGGRLRTRVLYFREEPGSGLS